MAVKERSSALRRWVWPLLTGTAMALLVGYLRQTDVSTMAAAGANQLVWCLSDGCFVAGLLLAGMGALLWISTTGFFDIFGYAMKSLLVLFSPLRAPEKHQKFLDYKAEREEKRRPVGKETLAVGAGFLVLAAVLLVLI